MVSRSYFEGLRFESKATKALTIEERKADVLIN
jgi:hypothetical protein